MTDRDFRERIVDQFSYRGDRADVWRGFDLLLDTDAFLNLGYSPWYLPHFVGSSQRRLARHVGDVLAQELSPTAGRQLLDVGCGRGGPAVELATRFGFRVTGVDLVPYNVDRARDNPRTARADARFLVGDATTLPIATDTMTAVTAIDALVYVPDRAAAIAEIGDVVTADGRVVISDLVTTSTGGSRTDGCADCVDAFADAWDMPRPATVAAYRGHFDRAGLELTGIERLSAHSVGRLRTWTTAFLALANGPLGGILERAVRAYGLDPRAVFSQIRRAHDALPALEHVLFVASPDDV